MVEYALGQPQSFYLETTLSNSIQIHHISMGFPPLFHGITFSANMYFYPQALDSFWGQILGPDPSNCVFYMVSKDISTYQDVVSILSSPGQKSVYIEAASDLPVSGPVRIDIISFRISTWPVFSPAMRALLVPEVVRKRLPQET